MIDLVKDVFRALKDFFSEVPEKDVQDGVNYQTFTYFLPAPKQGVSSYREKQFDKTIHEFLSRGWEVVDFKTQECTASQTSGMWIIFLVKSSRPDMREIDLESFGPEVLHSPEKENKPTPSHTHAPKSDPHVDYTVERDEDSLQSELPEIERKNENS